MEKSNKKCILCQRKHYARGWCKNHYHYYTYKRKIGHRKKCKIKDCLRGTTGNYCYYHRYRIEHNLPLDRTPHYRKGKNHMWWKGGRAEYPNHYLFKKNRLIILLNDPKCEICKSLPATDIHHKDFSKNNHSLSNLQPLCEYCHMSLHAKLRKTAWNRYKKKVLKLKEVK